MHIYVCNPVYALCHWFSFLEKKYSYKLERRQISKIRILINAYNIIISKNCKHNIISRCNFATYVVLQLIYTLDNLS